jgi:trimeric autotransporter adhesin
LVLKHSLALPLASRTQLSVAQALFNNTADKNTAGGFRALISNTTGNSNTANGVNSLLRNVTGDFNTAIGFSALQDNNASVNTAVGVNALQHNTTGDRNIALGVNAGLFLTTGSDNIDIANAGVSAEAATIRIGNSTKQFRTFIAGISGTAVVGDPVVVDANGQLGTATSSARFKKEIKPMDKASEAILALKPVSFHYKSDSKGTPQFGLIAEEVAKVNPDLVVRDRKGEIYSVRYDQVNAMLLNEFLKAHLRMEEQDKRIEELTAQLKEQAAQIQKVSAQLEASKPAPQVVNNP